MVAIDKEVVKDLMHNLENQDVVVILHTENFKMDINFVQIEMLKKVRKLQDRILFNCSRGANR